MQFTCTKENLLYSLTIVSGIAQKQNNLPILSHIHIEAKESGVELVATNLEIVVKAYLRAKVDVPGVFTVPGKMMMDCVQLLRGEQVGVEVSGNELKITSNNSTTKIKGAPGDDFPVIPEMVENAAYALDAEKFKEALSRVIFAAAKNEIRPELSGINFHFAPQAEGLVVAATDSYRLAEATSALSQGEEERQVIVPSRSAAECIRLISFTQGKENSETLLRLLLNENQISWRHNTFEITSRLIDGRYPDYRQIIPKSFSTSLVFPLDVVSSSIKSASLFSTTGVNAVSFQVLPERNILQINSASSQAGEHSSEIDVEVSGQENKIVLNHRYILDGLSHMGEDEVEFQMNNADAPCLFKPKSNNKYLYIVMPIRQ